ncbi:MAG: TlpA disulfide reductase family protein [Arachnia propionica]|uniref:TlpA family protein disulfide reductase n=1 Tax=Arachnia propionica TaxID=1750 RepID=UPI002706E3A6|nr:TlpA disulfide reductase family protein [Arachnia propionica]
MHDDDEVTEFLETEESTPLPSRTQDPAEPAWRARIRSSTFGQTAVVLVAAFAIAIAAWWVVKPADQERSQARGEAMSAVEVDGVHQPPRIGEQAPAFTATDIDGRPVSLEELRGEPVWLLFMATWCTGCRTEMPDVQAAATAMPGVKLVVVYVGENQAGVSDYSKRVGNDFPEIADQSQQISAAYGIMGVPSHHFIDAEGVVRQSHVGVLSPDAMTEALKSVTPLQ